MQGFKTIQDLYKAVQSGRINEKELSVSISDDLTLFWVGPLTDDDGNPQTQNEVGVLEAKGFYDVIRLYKILFPKADVWWN